jgi:PAS domain S-box-containing protein
MNLDNLLLRLQAIRERVGEMQTERSEALPQTYLPELTVTAIAEVSTALRELQSELQGVSDRTQLATSTLNSIIYNTEITKFQQAQKALHESERRFRAIFNNTFQYTGLLTPEGIVLEVNQAALDFIDTEPNAVIGQPFWDTPWWNFSPIIQQQLQATITRVAAGEFVRYEVEIPDADGFLHAFDFSLKPIKDETGQVVLLIPEARDITEIKQAQAALRQANEESELRVQERTAALSETNRKLEAEIAERKLAEEELRRSEERFRRAIVHAPIPLMIHAEDGEVIQINQAWTEETGYIHSDIPTTADWTAKAYGERRELMKEGIDRLYDLDTKVESGEFTITTRHGQTKIWDFSAAPLGRLGNGKRLIISMAKDVTARKIAEEALRQSEARFRAAVEGSLDAFFIFQSVRDETGQIVDFAFVELNSNGEKLISRRKEEVIGKRLCELIPINRTDGFFEKYVRVVETQEVLEEEFPLSSPDITASWLHYQVVPLADGIAVTSKDISDRKMAEEARKESEQRFRQLVETTSDWIWQVDENAVYTYVSPQVRDILGYEIEEVVGKTPFDLMPPEEAQRVAEIFSDTVASRQPFTNLENTNIHKNLHPVVLETSGVPVFDKAGNFRGYRGIDRDITQRKIAEAARRSSEERFRSLSACSPVGIFETDIAGRCLYTNPRYQEIYGCTLEESLGEGWSRFVHPEDRDHVFAEWSLYARYGREYSEEFRIQTQEGIVRWIHVRSSPMFSAQGELIGHVGTVEDITSARQAEADILAALHRERELSELRNSFLSLVSHEFRTPLTTIRSSAELLDHYNTRLSEEKKQAHYRRIESAVDRMTHLLDEVLLIGQAEAGKLKCEPQPMDLVPWCRDLVEGMQVVYNNQQQSTRHQYAITFTSTGECTDAQMDEKLLAHILTNLLSNAIKYSPEGGTAQFDLVCTAREAIFRITDNGIGIPAEYLPQLFESFQRASNVGTIQGTGLGLAIVKKAVDLYRGTIAVESEVGVGTTFTVRLPLKTSPLVSN